ncbi:hypothetical protein QE369_004431 [Agrobacterium larrymoorei]|uniref:Uncharacterized protein n=1 Tax=Agrobacterium larrymoorei TaxID=160699 RepID=A0AAJ2BEZ8_9HYPH|nr:hypothetical protein [Agrobacterium larrymoorei]MDR6104234.1 hypothetical protein [Agrobacterium larrymoorei]
METALSEDRKHELGKLAQRNIEGMAFPASQWEANTLAEVLALARVVVSRPSAEELLAIGMMPYNCHVNCDAQQANDTSGESRHITGWIIYGSDLILHSVVQIGRQWLCMTPQIVPVSPQFEFIPDPMIEWRENDDGNGKTPYRLGVASPSVLRRYPEDHIRALDRFRELVGGGLSAFEAREILAVTLGAELKAKGIL